MPRLLGLGGPYPSGQDKLPLDAKNVTYLGAPLDQVLGQILYVSPAITAFTANGQAQLISEIGVSLTNLALAWTLNKSLAPSGAQSINQGIGSVALGTTNFVVGGPVSTDTIWTLTATDGTTPVTRQASALFQHRRRWGAVDAAPANSADILALPGNAFTTGRVGTFTVANPGGKRICVAWPAAFGDPVQVKMRGFATNDYALTTVSFTNASGFTTSYRVLTTNNVLAAGDVSVEIS